MFSLLIVLPLQRIVLLPQLFCYLLSLKWLLLLLSQIKSFPLCFNLFACFFLCPYYSASGFYPLFLLSYSIYLLLYTCNHLVLRSHWGPLFQTVCAMCGATGCVFTKSEPSAPDAPRYKRQCPRHALLAGNYCDCSLTPAPCQQKETQYTFESWGGRLKENKRNYGSLICAQIMTHFTMQVSWTVVLVLLSNRALLHCIMLDWETFFSSCSPAGIWAFVFFLFDISFSSGAAWIHWRKWLFSKWFSMSSLMGCRLKFQTDQSPSPNAEV